MNKKGQTSIFIILGILVAIVILFIFFSVENINPLGSSEFDKNAKDAQSLTQECFKQIHRDSLDFIGAQGGYSKEPLGPYVSEIGLFFPIYNFNGDVNLPTNEIIEYELSLIIDENLPICIAQTKERYPTLEITPNNLITTTQINENTVNFITSGDLTVSNKENTINSEFKETEINSKLNNLILASKYYSLGSDSTICLDCITDISDRYDLLIDIANFQEGIIIVNMYPNEKESYPSAFTFLEVHDKEVYVQEVNYGINNQEGSLSNIKQSALPPQ